jgi:hypothetical protein
VLSKLSKITATAYNLALAKCSDDRCSLTKYIVKYHGYTEVQLDFDSGHFAKILYYLILRQGTCPIHIDKLIGRNTVDRLTIIKALIMVGQTDGYKMLTMLLEEWPNDFESNFWILCKPVKQSDGFKIQRMYKQKLYSMLKPKLEHKPILVI